MGLSYATEWFNGWYGGERADRSLVAFAFTGAYAPLFWALLLCNVVIPQAFWFAARAPQHHRRIRDRRSLINIGMWLERILIIWNTLSHDYMPSMWRLFLPTVWDWITTFGSLGLFALMFLVFVRLHSGRVDARGAQARRRRRVRHDATLLLAEFADPGALSTRRGVRDGARYRLVDAFTPFPVEGVLELLEHAPEPHSRRHVHRRHSAWRRWPMASNTTPR